LIITISFWFKNHIRLSLISIVFFSLFLVYNFTRMAEIQKQNIG